MDDYVAALLDGDGPLVELLAAKRTVDAIRGHMAGGVVDVTGDDLGVKVITALDAATPRRSAVMSRADLRAATWIGSHAEYHERPTGRYFVGETAEEVMAALDAEYALDSSCRWRPRMATSSRAAPTRGCSWSAPIAADADCIGGVADAELRSGCAVKVSRRQPSRRSG